MRWLLLLVLLLSSITGFSQEKRLALVIGNSAYEYGGVLKNPLNDANLMSTTLEALGFDVILKINASKRQMDEAILEYWRKLNQYDVALFYYAGHGVQVDGINYLVPVDAKLQDKLSLKIEAVDVGQIVGQYAEYPNNVNIVILDACRDNPYRSWVRSGSFGFAAMPAPSGTLIAFATAPGATASDGDGNYGLYTEKLTQQMRLPQRIEDVFINTRNEVRYASGGRQNPQEWSQLTGRFSFVVEIDISIEYQASEPDVKEIKPGISITESVIHSSGITYEKGFLASVKIYKDGNRLSGNEISVLYSSNKQALKSFQWARVKVGGAIAMLPWAGLLMASVVVNSVDGDPTMALMYGAPAVGTLTASFLLCRWARYGRVKALNSYYDNYQGFSISGTNHGVGLVYTF